MSLEIRRNSCPCPAIHRWLWPRTLWRPPLATTPFLVKLWLKVISIRIEESSTNWIFMICSLITKIWKECMLYVFYYSTCICLTQVDATSDDSKHLQLPGCRTEGLFRTFLPYACVHANEQTFRLLHFFLLSSHFRTIFKWVSYDCNEWLPLFLQIYALLTYLIHIA